MNLRAQDRISLDSIQAPAVIDSLFIDRNPANYSLRVFTNFKNQSFWFGDGNSTVKYTPNNRFGVGIGMASSKLLIDIAFNLRTDTENPTKRFDLRAFYKTKQHFFDFFFQRYKGFDQRVSGQPTVFRPDVVSVTHGINYLYLFNEKDYQAGPVRRVISKEISTAFSYGAGGFTLLISHQGDQPILGQGIYPENEANGIDRVFGLGAGALGGVGGFFSLGGNFYSSVTFNTGLGLMFKEVEGLDGRSYDPGAWLFQLNGVGVLGYVREQYYLNLSMELGFYGTDITDNLYERLNVAQAKLAFGYKIFKKKREQKLP
ncbi:hypothetical protein BST85_07330 [Aureitalea marina]|uniref:DUF4421 domain-containing protein n=2 Tax=Aureitalea marina TaxID=930804 RepID=A0A2S7KQ31_9FLAO|nr:hypothetical protein BST85_07330 [Aureitalea marina]